MRLLLSIALWIGFTNCFGQQSALGPYSDSLKELRLSTNISTYIGLQFIKKNRGKNYFFKLKSDTAYIFYTEPLQRVHLDSGSWKIQLPGEIQVKSKMSGLINSYAFVKYKNYIFLTSYFSISELLSDLDNVKKNGRNNKSLKKMFSLQQNRNYYVAIL
jgi:hypothetical protein